MIRKQRGIALFVVIIILPMLVVLGVMLLSSSSMDLKMSDARGTLDGSNISLTAASIEILTTTKFASASVGTAFSSARFTVNGTVQAISGEIDCKRRKDTNGNTFKCIMVDTQLSHDFGREKNNGLRWGINRLGVGFEQPLLVN